MRIMVDIIHPAHVHFFKHAIWEWGRRGHQVYITARDRDVALRLLDSYELPYVSSGKAGKGLFELSRELIVREAKIYSQIRKFKPDVILGVGGTFIVYAAKLTKTPSIVFTDTEHARLANAITFPFADVICTPSCFRGELGKKQVRYEGYQELAYLHPNYFRPNEQVVDELNLTKGERLIVVRFVSWTSVHDPGQKGFDAGTKIDAVKQLESYGRVLISAEGELPYELGAYRMSLSPEKIHDLLYYATMYIGEGGTTASEAAVLGTPSIFVSTLTLGYLEELEHRYGLVYSFVDQDAALEKAVELLGDRDVKDKWQIKRRKMLAEKIDVTAFMVDFVERYPESFWEYRTQQCMSV